ncbi:hypothetical protein [Algoriphagus sp. NG3]|uniref:hypothetical protein n=1 Tax=unclassified Algoriphagus TaxID=2641541 RepID=UPI002A834596|nr:hypothetical protein [Algoriphagus sp. NG3]WPR75928.1 hypothetical protein SLW71_01020 [Algoriphagus sp. NG3]
MKNNNKRFLLPALIAGAFLTFSCSEDDPDPIVQEGIEKSSLIFTEISGEGDFGAHGDHFHGINSATEGESMTIEFDSQGNAVEGGHLHLHPDGIYKVELQAWDYQGNRVEGDFIQDKATADMYKAFLVGGDLTLNPDTDDESGAVFQPREQTYGDGTAVSGQYETTGILGYFTLGESNEGEFMITYILREFAEADTKATITRLDWNSNDYSTKFPGQDVLALEFEIHAEDDHDH